VRLVRATIRIAETARLVRDFERLSTKDQEVVLDMIKLMLKKTPKQ
jgi:hypothetical protein